MPNKELVLEYHHDTAEDIIRTFLKESGYGWEIAKKDRQVLAKTRMIGLITAKDRAQLLYRLLLFVQGDDETDEKLETILENSPAKVCKMRYRPALPDEPSIIRLTPKQ